ncbi:hypothetical protein Y032_0042g520 [Ancylostoma ceylanicum]|uniref:Uncharacterized protein n=1 Tax=Ancylostoma ceylanicum TaxID=53326 RepID=A0A016UFT3_9BILA|nr:hypothetical protein Y032_0042g520 [Ancylostoma ceylanicum]
MVGVNQSHAGCSTHSTSSEHRRGVECVCALYSDLRRASDEPIQWFIFPDSSGTNLPTAEGWLAWVKVPAPWSRSGIRSSCAGCPPQQRRWVDTTWPVRWIRSTEICTFARKFAGANWYKTRHEKRV